MPYLTFRLDSPRLSFSSNAESDEWSFHLIGEFERDPGRRSFTIVRGEKSYDGFGIHAIVHINMRLPEANLPATPTRSPSKHGEECRDTIFVHCFDDGPSSFDVNIHLPPDAYQRIIEADWTKEALTLTVRTDSQDDALVYGFDPDGSDVEWLTDKKPYAYLEEVSVSFSPTASQKVSLEDQTFQANADDERPGTPVQRILDSVERATASIGELRATIVKVAWVLVAVLVVTAFIR